MGPVSPLRTRDEGGGYDCSFLVSVRPLRSVVGSGTGGRAVLGTSATESLNFSCYSFLWVRRGVTRSFLSKRPNLTSEGAGIGGHTAEASAPGGSWDRP